MRAVAFFCLVVMALLILLVFALAAAFAWLHEWFPFVGTAVLCVHWCKLWSQSVRAVRHAGQCGRIHVRSTPSSGPNPYYEAWHGTALADPRKDDCGRPLL